MVEFLLVVELALIAAVAYFTRDWEIRLLRGESLPRGKAALFLRFTRPPHWIKSAIVFVFVAVPQPHSALLLVLPIVFLHQAFLFAVNDYFDREVDSLNEVKKRRNVISSGELPLPRARVVLGFIAVPGLLLPLFLGWPVLLLSGAFLAASYAYSAPPLRLKGRVGWDLVAHAFLVFSYSFLFTTLAIPGPTPRNMAIYAVLVLVSVSIQMAQESRDFSDDAQVETNSVLALGYGRAYLLMGLLLSSALALSFWLVLSGLGSVFFLVLSALCSFAIYDLAQTWRRGEYSAYFRNMWLRINLKVLAGLCPVLVYWLLRSWL
ncbi:MAG: UbiA family prenyltransferase [bacterium]